MTAGDRVDDLVSLYLKARDTGAHPRPEELCREHPELLSELRRRLRALEAVGAMMTRGLPSDDAVTSDHDGGADEMPAPEGTRAGEMVGRYRLLECLGEGGMGPSTSRSNTNRSGAASRSN